MTFGFHEAEMHHLYDGGIQSESDEPKCAKCGEECGADCIEIHGEYYCGNCVQERTDKLYEELFEQYKYYDETLDKICLKAAMEDFIDNMLED